MREDRPKPDWEKLSPLLERLLDLPSEERAAFVEKNCAGDEELERELLRVMALESANAGFLESPGVVDLSAAGPIESARLGAGDRVGAYTLIALIGSGGMGAVWLARRSDEFEQRVAIKLIRPGFQTAEVLERFKRERQVLAGLDHPGVARLLDGGTLDDGRPYFAMEYVDGEPIDAYVSKRKLTLRERIELFLPVFDAVHHAHQRLVVHRDLKPSNVLVQANGMARLLDFGIAKLLGEGDRSAGLTRTDARPMTPRFASPEQVEGGTVTTRSDVYSLGVMLYGLLSGRSPYADTTSSVQLMREVCEATPTTPSRAVSKLTPDELPAFGQGASIETLRRTLSGDLDSILMMALRKDPERRYASAEHFADDLRRYLADQPVLARPDSWAYRASRFTRRNRMAVAAVSIAVLALVGATIFSTLSSIDAKASAREERRMRLAAQETMRFLSGILLSANPETGLGRDALVVDMLAGSREDAKAIEDPGVAGTVHFLLGATYKSLGEYGPAEEELRAAIERGERAQLPDHETQAARQQLGQLLWETQRASEGTAVLEECLRTLDEIDEGVELSQAFQYYGATVEEYRRNLLDTLASAYSEDGRHRKAIMFYRRALKRDPGVVPLKPIDRYRIQFNLGDSLLNLGRLGEAVEYMELAYDGFVALNGEENHPVPIVGSGLTAAYLHWNQPQRAERLSRAALATAEVLYGPEHPTTSGIRTTRAAALLSVGELDACEDLAVLARKQLYALGIGFDRSTEHILGSCLAAQGRLPEAEWILDSLSLATITHDLPPSLDTAAIHRALGECLEEQGRLGAAIVAYERSIECLAALEGVALERVEALRSRVAGLRSGTEVSTRLEGPTAPPIRSPMDAEFHLDRAIALIDLDRVDEGIELCYDVLEYHLAHSPEGQWAPRLVLGLALVQFGEVELGIDEVQGLHEEMVASLGARASITLICATQLGQAKTLFGQAAEARELLRSTITVAVQEFGVHSGAAWSARYAMASCLLELGEWAACEALTQELRTTRIGADNVDLLHLDAMLGQCWTASGRLEEAEQLLAATVARARVDFARRSQALWRGITQRAHGLCLAESGRPHEARAQLQAALESFEHIGGDNRYWVDRTRSEMAQLDGN